MIHEYIWYLYRVVGHVGSMGDEMTDAAAKEAVIAVCISFSSNGEFSLRYINPVSYGNPTVTAP